MARLGMVEANGRHEREWQCADSGVCAGPGGCSTAVKS
jgi:hypothetical protein